MGGLGTIIVNVFARVQGQLALVFAGGAEDRSPLLHGMDHGPWSVVNAPWSMVHGPGAMVPGPWSWSMSMAMTIVDRGWIIQFWQKLMVDVFLQLDLGINQITKMTVNKTSDEIHIFESCPTRVFFYRF